jgi:heme/copper-type cytochrome/quinol oxidase subunit 1
MQAGYRYDSRNLGFIVMFNTSHMAGFDAPIGVSLVLAELTGLMGEILKTNKLPDQWTPVSNVKIAGGLLIALLVCFIIYGAYKFRKRRRQQHYLPVDSPSLLQRAQSTPQANDLEMQALRSPSPKE